VCTVGEGIGLARALEELRRELGEAQSAGAHQQLRFEVEEATVELQLELRRDAKAAAGISFGVATIGADGSAASARTHRLTLRLRVRDEALGGRNAEVNSRQDRAWEE
jgi:hypothetical protein